MGPSIRTTIEIDAPIDKVWKEIYDISNWDWNKWTKLRAPEAKTGVHGKLHASYEGDDNWKVYDFNFAKVEPTEYFMNWQGSVLGGIVFSGNHYMKLEKISDGKTRLIHNEDFGGILPSLSKSWIKTLDCNYNLMNEALKKKLESQ